MTKHQKYMLNFCFWGVLFLGTQVIGKGAWLDNICMVTAGVLSCGYALAMFVTSIREWSEGKL